MWPEFSALAKKENNSACNDPCIACVGGSACERSAGGGGGTAAGQCGAEATRRNPGGERRQPRSGAQPRSGRPRPRRAGGGAAHRLVRHGGGSAGRDAVAAWRGAPPHKAAGHAGTLHVFLLFIFCRKCAKGVCQCIKSRGASALKAGMQGLRVSDARN